MTYQPHEMGHGQHPNIKMIMDDGWIDANNVTGPDGSVFHEREFKPVLTKILGAIWCHY